MCRLIIFLCSFTLVFNDSQSQVVEYMNYKYMESTYDIVVFKIDSSFINNFKIVQFKKNISEKKIYDSLSKKVQFFSCSASLFDSSCQFIGLYINNSKTISNINLNSGTGNFFVQPNGFIGVGLNGIDLKSSREFDSARAYISAIQSGPMLVFNNSINTAFDKQSTNKNIRLGVGSYSNATGSYLVFAASKTPVSFFEFSSLFKQKFNCVNALNLSGGSLVSFHSPSDALNGNTNKFPCNMIYVPIK